MRLSVNNFNRNANISIESRHLVADAWVSIAVINTLTTTRCTNIKRYLQTITSERPLGAVSRHITRNPQYSCEMIADPL